MIRGAGGAGGCAAVDIGRPAEQSTEMFRSLRSVALQLEQVYFSKQKKEGRECSRFE